MQKKAAFFSKYMGLVQLIQQMANVIQKGFRKRSVFDA